MEFNEPLFRVKGTIATAEQFLKAFQGSFPRVFPDKMEFQDFMEFAEDYADYVCTYEKSFVSRIKYLKQQLRKLLPIKRLHGIHDNSGPLCVDCALADVYERDLEVSQTEARCT
jgi:hypothetical protein